MPVKASSLRDRTLEFQSIGDRFKKSSSSALSTSNAPSSSGAVAAYDGGSASSQLSARSGAPFQTEFKRRVAMIGQGIHHTSQKLSKLAQLAKSTSLYNDPALEIQELTAVIKQDISALNNALVDVQLLSNSQNEAGLSSDGAAHSTKVVNDLKSSLMSTTKEFKEVLTKRTQNLKVQGNRRQQYSKETTNAFVRQRPLASIAPTATGTKAPLPWASDSGSTSQIFTRNQMDGESQPLLHQQQRQQQQQQMVPAQDTYMESRAESLHTIESTIHELSNIFTQLATMVSQQGEVAIRIDEHMEDTLTNVEGAQQQLVRYMNSISSNRWLMIKIFFVLVVFLMIFLFFVA